MTDQPADRSKDREEEEQGNRLLIRTWSDGEAAMVRQLLGTYGIPCQVASDVPHSVLPLTVDGLGEIRILVPASRLEQARTLLAEHMRQGLELLDGGKESGGSEDEDEDNNDDDEVVV